jgi:hypothetical protein
MMCLTERGRAHGHCGRLGLEKYEPVFRENEINADVPPELTELDIEKLGVPLGHRKRLLKAIAALRNDASVQPPAVTLAPRNHRLRHQLPRPLQKLLRAPT